jgi:Ca-activated chloride channel homolog
MKLSIYIITGWLVGLGTLSVALADSFDPKAREGITHYNREEFDQATTKFQASQLEQPENSDVAYNLANSHYRLGRYEEAVEAYKKTLTEKTPPNLKQKSWYNMGNAYYRMGYLEEAIDAYKKALELNPGDIDSKFNLEWARKQHEKAVQSGRMAPRDENILKQQAIRNHANNPADPQEKPEESPDANPEASENPQTTDNQPQGKPDAPDTPPTPSTPTPSGEKGIKPDAEEQAVQDALREMTQMTPEEAERWLGSLSEDLKKITRRQMQGQMKDMFADHDKDW